MQKDWTQHLLLRALTVSKRTEFNERIISNLGEGHFTSSLYKTVFRRLNTYYFKSGRILTWKELIADSSFSESVRRKLRTKEVKRKKLSNVDPSLRLPKSYAEYKSLLKSVSYDAKHVKLVELQNRLTERLGGEEITKQKIETLIEDCSSRIEVVKSLGSVSSSMFNVSSKEVREKIKGFYKELKRGFFLPTGFKEFDSRNIGIPVDSYFLIAAGTGCGKSSLILQLGINMKRAGARVCLVPLEMSIEQMLIRLGSNLLGVPVNKITANLKHYYKPLVKSIRRFIGKEDSPECFSFYEPAISEPLDRCLSILKPYDFDIVFIDYIGLMAPMKGLEDWKALDMAGRYAKRFATNNQTTICLVAQLDETEKKVRYAKALAEHASNAWYWYESMEEIIELNMIKIHQKKARGQSPVGFRLNADLATSRFRNYIYSEEEREKFKKKRTRRKTKKLAKGMDDIPGDTDV